jgi:hypothetical protein
VLTFVLNDKGAKERTFLRKESHERNCIGASKKRKRKGKSNYFSGTYIDERDAPIPGVPCRTGLFVIANSPR